MCLRRSLLALQGTEIAQCCLETAHWPAEPWLDRTGYFREVIKLVWLHKPTYCETCLVTGLPVAVGPTARILHWAWARAEKRSDLANSCDLCYEYVQESLCTAICLSSSASEMRYSDLCLVLRGLEVTFNERVSLASILRSSI